MGTQDAQTRELLQSDEEYRQLYEQHQSLKKQLVHLREKSLLSQEDEIEVKRIKLEKLRLKDQMSLRAQRHTATEVPA